MTHVDSCMETGNKIILNEDKMEWIRVKSVGFTVTNVPILKSNSAKWLVHDCRHAPVIL